MRFRLPLPSAFLLPTSQAGLQSTLSSRANSLPCFIASPGGGVVQSSTWCMMVVLDSQRCSLPGRAFLTVLVWWSYNCERVLDFVRIYLHYFFLQFILSAYEILIRVFC